MNLKTTYILFGILGTVMAVFFLVLWLGPTAALDSDYVLPSARDDKGRLQAKNIDFVAIERPHKGEKIVFNRDDTTRDWKMTEPHSLRVDGVAVDALVGQVLNATKVKHLQLTSDLKQWDLNDPPIVVTLKDGDHEWKVNVGAETGGSRPVAYLTSSDRPKEAVPVSRDGLDQLYKSANDFRSKVLLAGRSSDIEEMKFQKGDSKPVVLKRKSDGQWRIVEPDYGEADMGSDSIPGPNAQPSLGVRGLLSAL
jgi:hypothetical protein